MSASISTLLEPLVKAGAALLFANELRGFAVAAPVLYGMYEAGGTLMALWLGICSLSGIALSVVGPLFVVRKLEASSKSMRTRANIRRPISSPQPPNCREA